MELTTGHNSAPIFKNSANHHIEIFLFAAKVYEEITEKQLMGGISASVHPLLGKSRDTSSSPNGLEIKDVGNYSCDYKVERKLLEQVVAEINSCLTSAEAKSREGSETSAPSATLSFDRYGSATITLLAPKDATVLNEQTAPEKWRSAISATKALLKEETEVSSSLHSEAIQRLKSAVQMYLYQSGASREVLKRITTVPANSVGEIELAAQTTKQTEVPTANIQSLKQHGGFKLEFRGANPSFLTPVGAVNLLQPIFEPLVDGSGRVFLHFIKGSGTGYYAKNDFDIYIINPRLSALRTDPIPNVRIGSRSHVIGGEGLPSSIWAAISSEPLDPFYDLRFG